MSSLKNTIERIKTLETEKKDLLVEIEALKKMADAKAVALENEVGELRNEVKSLKTLINVPEPPSTPNKIQI
jgi:predicted  nucleic acid-binding Zn-ribbon protein